MERLPKRSPTGLGVVLVDHLLFRHSAMGTHLSCVEADFGVTEYVALSPSSQQASSQGGQQTHGKKVDKSHHHDHDSRRNNNSPECQTNRFLASGFLVEIAQDCIPEQNHRHTQHDKARVSAEQRPVPRQVASKERNLGDDQET